MKQWVCIFCGRPVPEQWSEHCGEVAHTELVDKDEDELPDNHPSRGGPDYRLPEQYYADLAHEKRRKHMLGED